MNEQELRGAVESAFTESKKEKIPSNELRDLLKFAGDSRAWGGLCFNMLRLNILEKCDDKPVKSGHNKFFYYRLIKNSAKATTSDKAITKFAIFNETTTEYETVIGEIELEKRIATLLDKNDYKLEIYKLTEIVQPERKIERVKIL